jgi:ferric-dicitrate binding protein FerR (iron transport regulator)
MLDNYEHIAILITGFNNSTLTGKKHDELDEWINADDQNKLLFEELSDPNRLREYLQQMEEYDQGGSWEKIKRELPLTIIPNRHLFPWKKIAVAASIIFTLSLGAYFAFFNKTKKEEIVKLPESKDVEAPKATKAMITLSDGRIVSIDSLTTIDQANVKLTKTADGKIIYAETSSSPSGEAGVRYNSLSNPRGSKVIDMTLSDGSHVWLNAGSSVTYPVAFAGNERKVSITGEAYFEVSHDVSKPFVVNKGEINVQVLGTHFNVNAYDDEPNLKITLLEGSVKILNKQSFVVIKPGQQAEVSSEIRVVNEVDVEEIMAWKNGKFQFGEKADIGTIMRQIARWYDVDVEYKGTFTKHFGGSISREVNISQVLKVLETTGDVKFKVEGRKIIISPL